MELEHFFAACSSGFIAEYPLVISVMLGGLLGSASHCSLMCAPLVAAHMLELQAARRPMWLLGLYHAGRIGSYMLLGATAAAAGQWLFGGRFVGFSHFMMLAAGLVFVASAALPQRTHASCHSAPLRRVAQRLGGMRYRAPAYFLRGVAMGFMPCGLLLSALLMAGALASAGKAALLMGLFGLSTLPMLYAAAHAALRLGSRYPRFGAGLGRVAMAGNGIFLCGMGLNLVHIS